MAPGNLPSQKIAVIGGGVFGAAAALECAKRGHSVTLFDPGPLPHPSASSTDISKVIRPDYGADDFYTDLMMESLRGWDRWNRDWDRPLYHEDGFIVLAREPMVAGGFEYESRARLAARGLVIERLDRDSIRRRFPAWNADYHPHGYFNPRAGWAESAAVVSQLLAIARRAGARIIEGATFDRLLESGSQVTGVRLVTGETFPADCVVLAAGAWTPVLLPELRALMRPVAQPVVHLAVDDPSQFRPPRFACWAADISRTGWYGFPALADGTLKFGHHGPGNECDPPGPASEVSRNHIERLREFLALALPSVRNAPVRKTRLCFYCDTWDGNFYLDRHPDHPGLVVAAGGSGHAFKFAPVLGPLIADAVEGLASRWSARFAWRARGTPSGEDARFKSSPRKALGS